VTKSWVIHVVDDDEPVRESFVFGLQAAGFHAVAYPDADDFLARGGAVRGMRISDVRMPGMNGIELTRLLRRSGWTAPVILVTGHADDELEADAVGAGADLLMRKPVALTALVAEIDRMTTGWT
jgi:two-component system response regulator FixJ